MLLTQGHSSRTGPRASPKEFLCFSNLRGVGGWGAGGQGLPRGFLSGLRVKGLKEGMGNEQPAATKGFKGFELLPNRPCTAQLSQGQDSGSTPRLAAEAIHSLPLSQEHEEARAWGTSFPATLGPATQGVSSGNVFHLLPPPQQGAREAGQTRAAFQTSKQDSD